MDFIDVDYLSSHYFIPGLPLSLSRDKHAVMGNLYFLNCYDYWAIILIMV